MPLQRLQRFFGRLWGNVVDAVTVLWITRVSVISVLIGAVLFVAIPPVRDTFLEMRGANPFSFDNLIRWIAFFTSAILFWALPVHYAARRNVQHDPFFADSAERESERQTGVDWWGLWIPRLLGAACLALIAAGALLARNVLRVTPQGRGAEVPGSAAQLYDYVDDQAYAIAAIAGVLCIAIWIFLMRRRTLFFGTSQHVGTMLLAALLAVFVVLFFIPVGSLGLARAPLIPLLIGGWIPLLALLAYYGRMRRAPLILLLFLVLELLTFAGNNHDVRMLWASPDGSPARSEPAATGRFHRPSLTQAIADWRSVNCPQGNCPRPILVAASGGASRAGFFTAATLGELLDRTRQDPRLNDFQNQLFAISSVSGSSTGAAFFAAALRESHDGSNPCRDADSSRLVYFNDRPTSWRHCMEQLLAGDFISSTLMAYVYKDAIRGAAAIAAKLGFRIPDRAGVLESSWEQQFCRQAKAPDCDTTEFRGLEAPFLEVAGPTASDRAEMKWFPLLFFNSTDVDTGRRIVVSPVASHVQLDDQPEARIFADAYDFHDLLADTPTSEKGRKLEEQSAQFEGTLDRDISLSTAALLSARFPIISPPGVVLNRKGKVVARIVDGGYFENFGAATAQEIAQQLQQAGLRPFIIEITNDPELLVAHRIEKPATAADDPKLCKVDDVDPLCEEDPPINDAENTYWFSDIRGPLSSVFSSRNAHGGQALRSLSSFNGAGTGFCPSRRDGPGPNKPVSFVHIVVHPQYRLSMDGETCKPVEVPLNWWLSKPVQLYLDDQITQNKDAIGEVVKVLEKKANVASTR
ncbi:hypothetical protein [Methyloceanibacter sp.]|uniref:hypothetical protein n=1 Tax=Methyloceanibacter sp. TaxID=1965321 RepID=UPI003D6CBDFC